MLDLRRHHAVALPALLGLAACAGGEAAPGFDGELDPELLEELSGKFDHNACADFPGGELAGDDLLVLVNKQPDQQLQRAWAPADLVDLDDALVMPGRAGQLRAGVVAPLAEMFAAAAGDDVELGVRSAYRSYRTQCITFSFKVRQHGIEHARRFSAEPGRSQHQLGTTVDITTPSIGWSLVQGLADEPEGQWLAANATRFGFALSYPEGAEHVTGYAFEPWHYRYIGREAAAELEASGLILEEYLAACAAPDGNDGERGDLSCPRETLPGPVPNDGWIGGACETDADCADIDGGFCLTGASGYAGGHCTRGCSETCPDRAGFNATTFCVASAAGDLCHAQCDTDVFGPTGCRDGYVCVEGTRPSGSRSAGVCLPAVTGTDDP